MIIHLPDCFSLLYLIELFRIPRTIESFDSTFRFPGGDIE